MMKKWKLAVAIVACAFALAGCGNGKDSGNDGNKESVSYGTSLEMLTNVWATYTDEEKFPIGGGMPEDNIMDAPGALAMTDGEVLDSMVAFPKDCVDLVADGASIVNMMNGNLFTGCIYQLKEPSSTNQLAEAIKNNIDNRHWMCGFPEHMYVATISDKYVVAVYGNTGWVTVFKEKLAGLYPDINVIKDEDING